MGREQEVRYAINLQEERQKKIVSNINENEQKPDKSEFLSTKNSRSTSPDKSQNKSNQPSINKAEIDELQQKSGEETSVEKTKKTEEKQYF